MAKADEKPQTRVLRPELTDTEMRRLKAVAALRGITLAEVTTELLREGIRREFEEATRPRGKRSGAS